MTKFVYFVFSLVSGGHIYYLGTNKLALLGLIDASECPPTYGSCKLLLCLCLTHLCLMTFPIFINWTSLFPILVLFGGFFHFQSNFNRTFCKQTEETRYAASDLVLHCLLTSHKKEARF